MSRVRTNMARLLFDNFKVDPRITEVLFEVGILTDKAARDALIKDEYLKGIEPREKERLKNKLADKYCLSLPMIKKILHNNCQSV